MKKYDVQGVIGMGAYGVVLRATNKHTKETVAIKKFKESDSNPIIKKIALREVKALKNVNDKNVVRFIEAFRRENKLNIVFEFVDKTVLEDIENNPEGLDSEVIKSYIYQLLKALKYLHENQIIHRDVKPENLLVNNEGVLKLCDFGFARKVVGDKSLTDYVATRWYRSPELILTSRYSFPVDVWSVGCIMGELMDGQPIFPGDDTLDQLYHIMRVLGPFNSYLKELFSSNDHLRSLKLPEVKKYQTLQKRYRRQVDAEGLDLLSKLLEMDPRKRLTAAEALNHPYFSSIVREENTVDHKQTEKHSEVNKENLNENTPISPADHTYKPSSKNYKTLYPQNQKENQNPSNFSTTLSFLKVSLLE